jgi:hypothetical protein
MKDCEALYRKRTEYVTDTTNTSGFRRMVQSLKLALSNGPNRPTPHLKAETDPVYETLLFSVLFEVIGGKARGKETTRKTKT